MNIGILYLCMSFIYILLVCLDGEDVKPKWKQWLAEGKRIGFHFAI